MNKIDRLLWIIFLIWPSSAFTEETNLPSSINENVCSAVDFLSLVSSTSPASRSLQFTYSDLSSSEILFEPVDELTSTHCVSLTYQDLMSDIFLGKNSCKKPDSNYVNVTASGDKVQRKVYCTPKILTDGESVKVQLINSSILQEKLNSTKDENEHYCAVVMFYAPWCHFCARTAPHYNALARAFPHMDIFAIDAVIHSSINFRYGTVAVPNILIFHNSKAVARFNTTERNLERLSSFIANVTGMAPVSAEITEEDYIGPLSSTPTEHTDHYLWLAWSVVLIFSSTLLLKSSALRDVWNALGNHMGHIEQAHID